MEIKNCRIIELNKLTDPRGNLTFIESSRHIPFEVKRVYYLYEVPRGENRGGHAHKALQQLIIAIRGSFEICLDDGKNKEILNLNKANEGLYLPNMIWREIRNFSKDSICLVLASEFYDESDYFRDYSDFIDAAGKEKQ